MNSVGSILVAPTARIITSLMVVLKKSGPTMTADLISIPVLLREISFTNRNAWRILFSSSTGPKPMSTLGSGIGVKMVML